MDTHPRSWTDLLTGTELFLVSVIAIYVFGVLCMHAIDLIEKFGYIGWEAGMRYSR